MHRRCRLGHRRRLRRRGHHCAPLGVTRGLLNVACYHDSAARDAHAVRHPGGGNDALAVRVYSTHPRSSSGALAAMPRAHLGRADSLPCNHSLHRTAPNQRRRHDGIASCYGAPHSLTKLQPGHQPRLVQPMTGLSCVFQLLAVLLAHRHLQPDGCGGALPKLYLAREWAGRGAWPLNFPTRCPERACI